MAASQAADSFLLQLKSSPAVNFICVTSSDPGTLYCRIIPTARVLPPAKRSNIWNSSRFYQVNNVFQLLSMFGATSSLLSTAHSAVEPAASCCFILSAKHQGRTCTSHQVKPHTWSTLMICYHHVKTLIPQFYTAACSL